MSFIFYFFKFLFSVCVSFMFVFSSIFIFLRKQREKVRTTHQPRVENRALLSLQKQIFFIHWEVFFPVDESIAALVLL